MALGKMREMKTGALEVVVDNEVSKENVTRAATNEGWRITCLDDDGTEDFRLLLERS
jgi:TusA-related sulfurtransferase